MKNIFIKMLDMVLPIVLPLIISNAKVMKTKTKKNWHLFECNILRQSWLTREEAEAEVKRYKSFFPDVDFYCIKLDSLVGVGVTND